MYCTWFVPTFQRNVLLPSAGYVKFTRLEDANNSSYETSEQSTYITRCKNLKYGSDLKKAAAETWKLTCNCYVNWEYIRALMWYTEIRVIKRINFPRLLRLIIPLEILRGNHDGMVTYSN
jgi:hypothetical protein